jgi:hypothetical protein
LSSIRWRTHEVAELPAKAGMSALIDANTYGCWN